MRKGTIGWRIAPIAALVLGLSGHPGLAFDRPVVGRLIDGNGAVIAGAQVYITAIDCSDGRPCEPTTATPDPFLNRHPSEAGG
jgi:hypothetical protein